jgi:hypothetical protein
VPPRAQESSSTVLRFFAACVVLSLCALIFGGLSSVMHAAQNVSEAPGEEVVANLAAGRAILLVTKDAILIATVENPIEAQTHVPAPVQMSGLRAGILLGAEDWFSPSSRRQIARLDRELPRLRAAVASGGAAASPSLSGTGSSDKEAVDLEVVGEGIRQRASEIALELHGKIDLPTGEPFLEAIITDYASGYGPEIWELSYSLEQEEERSDYWTTTVTHPVYEQFYPPEKGQPHTLVEFSYPPSASPTLLDLLKQNDPRFSSLRGSDPKIAAAIDRILDGQAQKLPSADAIQFLRAAVEIVAPPKARITFAEISEQDGFSWILPPPAEPKPRLQEPEREPGAPSLVHPSGE